MRTLGPSRARLARWSCALAGLAALVSLGPSRAIASCTYNSIPTPSGVFALTGDVCAAAPGTYSPTVQPPDVPLKVPYTGFGFFAYFGGVINSPGAVTINTTRAIDAYGAWSDGTGAQINFSGATTVSTAGVNSFGLYAYLGGAISATAPTITTTGANSAGALANTSGVVSLSGGAVTTSGAGAPGLFAAGPGSTMTASGVAVTTNGGVGPVKGSFAAGVSAYKGGSATFSGGSITTNGASAPAAASQGAGSSVTLSGGTTILTNGDGSVGLVVNGPGASLTATGVSVTTHGGTDTSTGFVAVGAFNGPFMSFATGGAMKLTDTTIVTTGAGAQGVVTNSGGATTLTGTTIQTSGSDAYGVDTYSGGATTVSGGSVKTTGLHAIGVLTEDSGTSGSLTGTTISTSGNASTGVELNGTGSSLALSGVTIRTTGSRDPTTGFDSIGVYNGTNGIGTVIGGGTATITNSTISTSGDHANGVATRNGGLTTISGGSINTAGNAAYAVAADSGGVAKLTGTTIGTTGNGSGGLGINGAGSEIDATNVTITTKGGFDSASGQHSYGVYNGPFGSFTTGGVAKLTDTSVSTQGVDMHGVITSTGGTTTISGVSISTGGDGAIGLLAKAGGVVSATGAASITTTGGVSSATGLGAYGINADGAGSRVQLGAGTITTSGAGATALFACDAAASGAAGSITVSGTLNVKTTNAAAAAVGLQGDGATILVTGGGTIVSAGNAIEFMGGTNQTATFDNFNINNQTGDLIFADPSVATINFNNTVANAGTNTLLNATNGSDVTLNASASTLTGAIHTDSTSTTNVNLTNSTTWTMTGSSTVTNLSLTNSVVVFAPPGSGVGFKTLTVTNYVGSGANIIMNATLGGAPSASDRIIVNGGRATGFTLLTVNNFGGLGGATSGAGIPLVVATNGGTVAPGAFALANTPLVGGFRYMLEESNNDWYLVSTPAPTHGEVQGSINQGAKAQQTQIITNRVLDSILLGATQQISTCSCGGGFASVGSFAAGAQGRWGLSDELSLIGGFSYNQWYASGISVENAPTVAGALIYDLWKWGESRPFFEVGGALTPYEDVHYTRYYANGLTTGVGNASAIDRDLSLFARAGWIDRLSSVDEAAVYGDLGRNWMQTGGSTEMTSALNPFPAAASNGLDTLNVARLGGQFTHLFNGDIEANVSAAVAYGFGAGAGAAVSVSDFGPIAPSALPSTTWMEYGARLGYRFNDRLVIDAFVVGTAFGEVGTAVHGGIGLRYAF